MNLLYSFQQAIKDNHLFSPKDKLVLAVSGGVDSVVLCELCHLSGHNFMIAHCNFQLRGEESERDEQFVRQLAEKYKVAIEVKRFDTEKYATQKKIATQEAARELRYAWFNELIVEAQKKPSIHHSPFTFHVLTAHHADDNAETVLMNFARGTGLHGLTGIPVSIGSIRRPLLSFSKEVLMQFARENDLAYVEDSSNQSSKYTRNLFRNEIIPLMSKAYPKVKDNLEDNIVRFKEIEKLYQTGVVEIKKRLCRQKGNEVHIPVKQLMGFHNKALIYEIIAPYGFSEKQVEEVQKLADADSGKYIQSPTGQFRVIKHRHWLIISPSHPEKSENIIIEETDKIIQFENTKLEISLEQNIQYSIFNIQFSNELTACLDAKEIVFPLLLRKWKTGDYFYPLGMKKKKKLSRFFIDQKLSKTEKEKVWVIEMNKKIIWVVGHRIDERFKITETTTKILKLIAISY